MRPVQIQLNWPHFLFKKAAQTKTETGLITLVDNAEAAADNGSNGKTKQAGQQQNALTDEQAGQPLQFSPEQLQFIAEAKAQADAELKAEAELRAKEQAQHEEQAQAERQGQANAEAQSDAEFEGQFENIFVDSEKLAGLEADAQGEERQKVADKNGETDNYVTFSRVQGGESKEILVVNNDGTLSINPMFIDSDIYVSTGNDHADYFKEKRGEEAYIVKFYIPEFLYDITQQNAIPQAFSQHNPFNQGGMAPKVVDANLFERKGFDGVGYQLSSPLKEWFVEYAKNAHIVEK